MAILRAGPFASSSDSFLDEPDEVDFNVVPVNCALDDTSSNWPWKFYQSLFDPASSTYVRTYEDGLPDLNESINSGPDGVSVNVAFYYQAVSDFKISISYSLGTTSTSVGLFTASARVQVDGVDVYNEDDLDGDEDNTVEKTTEQTLPEAIVPKRVSILLTMEDADGDYDIALSISPA